MKAPTGKLAFAYQTIATLEARIADLEARPPAPVAVALPERMEYHRFGQVLTVSNAHVDGWNACLDKVKEMNA